MKIMVPDKAIPVGSRPLRQPSHGALLPALGQEPRSPVPTSVQATEGF